MAHATCKGYKQKDPCSMEPYCSPRKLISRLEEIAIAVLAACVVNVASSTGYAKEDSVGTLPVQTLLLCVLL